MTYQDFTAFPFVGLGTFLIMCAIAIQIVRGKLGKGAVEFIKASKGAFDASDDALVVFLSRQLKQKPDDVRGYIASLYLMATGEPLNAEAQAKLYQQSIQSVVAKDAEYRSLQSVPSKEAGTTINISTGDGLEIPLG